MISLVLAYCFVIMHSPFPSHDSVGLYFKIQKLSHAGAYLLAKFEAVADRKMYHATNYIISGHSLQHLCLAAVPALLSIMLMRRNIKLKGYCPMDMEFFCFIYSSSLKCSVWEDCTLHLILSVLFSYYGFTDHIFGEWWGTFSAA